MTSMLDKIKAEKEKLAATNSGTSVEKSDTGPTGKSIKSVENATSTLQPEGPKEAVERPKDATVVDPKPQQEHWLWATPVSPTYQIHLGGGTVQAKDGVLTLNRNQHEELQRLIASGRPDIAANVKYLDLKEAAIVAQEYKNRHNKPAAHQGAAHSAANAEKGGTLHPVDPKKIEGAPEHVNNITGASAASILANVKEEDAFHADETGVKGDGAEEGSKV